MKNIVFLLAFVGMTNAQNIDPDFFNQTWYLYEVYDSDFEITFVVDGYQPYAGKPTIDQIMPYIIIEDTFEFNGVGICNTINGTLEEDPIEGWLRTVTTSQTTNACGFYEDQDERLIFGPFAVVNPDPTFFTIVTPTVSDDSDGFQTMQFGTQPFLQYTYRNTPILALGEEERNKIAVYPNPVDDILFIDTQSQPIDAVRVFSMAGTIVSEADLSPNNHTVNTSRLAKGIYFVTISAENRTQTFKVVKE